MTCLNATISCDRCSAGTGAAQSSVQYRPNSHCPFTYRDHPQVQHLAEQRTNARLERSAKRDRVKSKQVKQGLRAEKEVARKVIKQTVKSGAAFNDGDYQSLDGLLQGDHKLRHRTKNFAVSWEEYTQGRRSGTNQWLITVTGDDNKQHTLVCLTMDAYTKLLQLASGNLNDNG